MRHTSQLVQSLEGTMINIGSSQFNAGIVSHHPDSHRYWWKVCQGQLNLPQRISLRMSHGGNTTPNPYNTHPYSKHCLPILLSIYSQKPAIRTLLH